MGRVFSSHPHHTDASWKGKKGPKKPSTTLSFKAKSISIVKARDCGVGYPTIPQITGKNAPHRLPEDRRSANLASILGRAGRLKSKAERWCVVVFNVLIFIFIADGYSTGPKIPIIINTRGTQNHCISSQWCAFCP